MGLSFKETHPNFPRRPRIGVNAIILPGYQKLTHDLVGGQLETWTDPQLRYPGVAVPSDEDPAGSLSPLVALLRHREARERRPASFPKRAGAAQVANRSHGQFARDELRQQSYGLMNPALRP